MDPGDDPDQLDAFAHVVGMQVRTDTTALVAALSAWGRAVHLEGHLGGGNRSSIWSVRIAGRRYAARVSARPLPALEWEFKLLQHLYAAGMCVPQPCPAQDGHTIADGLAVFEWLDGDPPTSEADWSLVSGELKRLHDLTRDWPQRPSFRSTQQLLEEDRGGDVRLDLMPLDAVLRIRAAWRALSSEPMSVIHGDPGRGNILMHRGRVGLIDWDEARVDVSLLDLADLPLDLSDTIAPARMEGVRQAAHAWEAANGWIAEPEYARRRLAQLYLPPPRRL